MTQLSRRPKGEGQWAVGHSQPLNEQEQVKKDDNPLRVRLRIERQYAVGGFASIDPDDLHHRFRWWGLYTQRKPGLAGGATGVLQPHELEDEYFMLRIRIDGGQLTLSQLRVIADISTFYARDTADITDRQNIQLHWIRVEDVPDIWSLLEEVGLSTTEACGDCPRIVLGSPVAGILDEPVDAAAAIAEIVARYVGDPSLANLPRKFKSSVSWFADVPYQANDLAFVGVWHPVHGPGFDVWVGGGLSTNPMLAQRLGTWVSQEDVADVWAGVVGVFRDWGYRRLRSRARLKFLVADWGPEAFREMVERRVGRRLYDGPAPDLPDTPIDHIGVHQQSDGRFYIGCAPVVGRVSGSALRALADLMESVGSQRARLTPYQKLLVLDVPGGRVAETVAGLQDAGFAADPSTWRRNTMSCTGIEFCKLAVVETKGRAAGLVAAMEQRLADLDTDITVNLNGCPNSCARTQIADIGLKGQLMPDGTGGMREGFQVHLGGGLAMAKDHAAGFGRKSRGLKVAADDLPDYVERVTRRYLAGRDGPGEPFARWVLRAAEEDLR